MPDIKPLLAGKAVFEKIQYPVWASPKLDGIRCLGVDDAPMSRKLKPIPNRRITKELTRKGVHINGLDGELMVRGDFNKVQSAVMSRDGEPDFFFNVFDAFQGRSGRDISHKPFWKRHAIAARRVAKLVKKGVPAEVVPHVRVHNEKELRKLLEKWIGEGYEGLMIRDPDGRYKYGESTVKEGLLLKVKKFLDDEGELVEIIEKQHNTNRAEKDELGNTKRSSAKAGLVPAGTSGAMIVRWKGEEFKVGFGPGIDDAVKQDWWNRREELVGKLLKFKYQELSKDGIPRFGKALGFRHPDDLS